MRSCLSVLVSILLAATFAAADPAIDAIYKDIHDDVCTEMGVPRCPSLEDPNARWAFVAMWCEQHTAEDRCKTLPDGPAVIAFNHDTKQWRAVRGLDPDDVEQNANGIPTVHASTGDKVVAVVESTNPLLYV
ncbi:MAG TPA: hypothetical protein VF266_11970, partial [Thermoanaerobaculia bacterium]